MDDLLQVGVIAATHGLRGEVKVFPTTDDVQRFKKLKECLLDTGKENIRVEIESCKFFKQFVIVKFKGIDHINDIEGYKGYKLLVTRENAIKLNKDEYFIADMIGISVIDEEDQVLGTLTDVLLTGANDVYVIETPEKKEILIPAIKECILAVDIKEGFLKVHLLEGLVE